MPASNKRKRTYPYRYTVPGRPDYMPWKSGRIRSLVARKRKSMLKKFVKQQMLKMSETKFTSYNYVLGALGHNTGTAINLWTNNASSLFPTVGDSENNRDGNEIVGRGFMIRGMFNVPYDRRDVRIDYYFVQHNTNMGDPTTSLFHNVATNVLLDPINKKRWDNVTKLGSLRVKATDAGMHSSGSWLADNVITKTILFKKWIPLNKKLKFYDDNASIVTNVPEMGKIIFFVYDTLSTASTDTIVHSGSITATFYYKDP